MSNDINGTVNPPLPETSILQTIREAWKTAGAKDPTGKTKDAAIKHWKDSRNNVAKAETALLEAKKADWAACEALARLYGAKSLRIDGVVYDFASRGPTVFMRAKGGANVVDV